MDSIMIVIVIVCVFLILLFVVTTSSNNNDTNEISDLTDKWINRVTVKNDSDAVARMFCSDGNLVGTVSQIKRKGRTAIKEYFDYFAHLPNIRVVSRQYNISQVDANVFLNTAFIEWMWDGLKEPVTARMTFLFRNRCIFQLHSSKLPDLNSYVA
jgi:uncharacterized protein (TIGR02246 family)